MVFDRPMCPKCRRPARAVATTLAGFIEIAPTEGGSFTRTGQSIRWDTETPVVVEDHHLLHCGCGEVWLARRLDEDDGGRVLPFSPGEPPEDPPGSDPCPPGPPLDSEFSARIRALKPRLKRKLAARRAARRRIPPISPAPRYDEVYFRGLEWLDRL